MAAHGPDPHREEQMRKLVMTLACLGLVFGFASTAFGQTKTKTKAKTKTEASTLKKATDQKVTTKADTKADKKTDKKTDKKSTSASVDKVKSAVKEGTTLERVGGGHTFSSGKTETAK